jgi:hypothetical protein
MILAGNTGIPLFEALVLQKWNEFARTYHIIWNLLPHYFVVLIYLGLVMVRVPAIYERRFGIGFPGVFVCSL